MNAVHGVITCDKSILKEIQDYFTFTVPEAKFTPAYRNKLWDGKIRLVSLKDRKIYIGLLDSLAEFAKDRNYTLAVHKTDTFDSVSEEEVREFIKGLGLPHEVRDYQFKILMKAFNNRRHVFVSPTASGKSLNIYIMTRWFLESGKKVLIIVPTINLVTQLESDFREYGHTHDNVHKIFGGEDKNTDSDIVISTWQSLVKLPEEWFQKFSVVINDEVHLAKSKSLMSILGKTTNSFDRFGFTGTIDNKNVNSMILTGLFGPIEKVITTAELIEQEYLSKLHINCIMFKYPDEIRKGMRQYTYPEEIEFISSYAPRNRMIQKLSMKLKGTVLILFRLIDKQGKLLHEMYKDTDRPIHYIDGSVDGEEREDLRQIVKTQKDPIILGSIGTVSTGVNIPQIDHIIFASPSKSRIRSLQSIGRGLRKTNDKYKCTLWDLSDDLSWKAHKNFTLKHFSERIEIYNEQQFPYKITTTNL